MSIEVAGGKRMQSEQEKSVVVISIPRFCVPKKDAAQFIKAANEYWSDTVEEMLSLFGPKRLEFDNYYCNGEFIPTVRQVNSYSYILDTKVSVEQVDKYIQIGETEPKYKDEIVSLWHQEAENEVQEEIEEEN